jgi:hypothetical protein
MRWLSSVITSCVFVTLLCATNATAQRRPFDTQDPQPVGEGHILIEGGVTYAHQQFYPLSGLQGNLWQLPLIGFVVGVGPIADVEITGGPYNRLEITDRRVAPLADLVTTGPTTHAVEDLEIGTKLRLVPESEQRPAVGFRFIVRLPNAKHASGLGQDTTDFSGSFLVGKQVAATRLVANAGLTIMSEPLDAAKQNDVMTYGFSIARPLVSHAEVVAEINGRWSTRSGVAPIGTESRGLIRVGGRYRLGAIRLDAAALFGVRSIDPDVGVTIGLSYLFRAFTLTSATPEGSEGL